MTLSRLSTKTKLIQMKNLPKYGCSEERVSMRMAKGIEEKGRPISVQSLTSKIYPL